MNILDNYQHKLFAYAYNILGSSDDALDVIQDVMTGYIAMGERKLENEMGYLVRSVVNKAITKKTSNQKTQRGVWLPEPVATENADSGIRQKEIISYSLLVLLEYLNPKERAVFILKEAFDYSHEEIAEALAITVDNSRKLLSRAREVLKTNKAEIASGGFNAPINILEDYIQMIKSGDIKNLEMKLSQDVKMMADGGSKISIVRALTLGNTNVADLVNYLFQHYHQYYQYRLGYLNHQPAIFYFKDGVLVNCMIFEIGSNTDIQHIYSVVDPDKLKNLSFS